MNTVCPLLIYKLRQYILCTPIADLRESFRLEILVKVLKAEITLDKLNS